MAGGVRIGLVRLGSSRWGMVDLAGLVGPGSDGGLCCGIVSFVLARYGRQGKDWFVKARCVELWTGEVGCGRQVELGRGRFR